MDMDSFVLWAPDIIKESNGIACGDMLSISAYRDKGKFFFLSMVMHALLH